VSIHVAAGTQPAIRMRRPGTALAWLLAGATIGSNIAWILASGPTRDLLTVAGVCLFFSASLVHSAVTRPARWTLTFFTFALLFGWAVEALGTGIGLPFGDYAYSDRLGWSLGPVPVLIPMAWAMMAYPVFVVVERTGWGRTARIALAGTLLASWDLFLDPQMVAEGHWVWASPEPALPGIPGIPISNFIGWLVASTVLMTILTLTPPMGSSESPGNPQTQHPITQPGALLAWVYVGSILANAVFLDRPAVALAGALGMGLPLAILAARLRRIRRG
jgi:putative membrane protein